MEMRYGYSPWPLCSKTPGFTLELHNISSTAVELVAEGLEPQGILYIFYRQVPGYNFSGVVPVYPYHEQWLAFVNLKTVTVDPWSKGPFVYTLNSLPPGSRLEVSLAHPTGVACAQITLQ